MPESVPAADPVSEPFRVTQNFLQQPNPFRHAVALGVIHQDPVLAIAHKQVVSLLDPEKLQVVATLDLREAWPSLDEEVASVAIDEQHGMAVIATTQAIAIFVPKSPGPHGGWRVHSTYRPLHVRKIQSTVLKGKDLLIWGDGGLELCSLDESHTVLPRWAKTFAIVGGNWEGADFSVSAERDIVLVGYHQKSSILNVYTSPRGSINPSRSRPSHRIIHSGPLHSVRLLSNDTALAVCRRRDGKTSAHLHRSITDVGRNDAHHLQHASIANADLAAAIIETSKNGDGQILGISTTGAVRSWSCQKSTKSELVEGKITGEIRECLRSATSRLVAIRHPVRNVDLFVSVATGSLQIAIFSTECLAKPRILTFMPAAENIVLGAPSKTSIIVKTKIRNASQVERWRWSRGRARLCRQSVGQLGGHSPSIRLVATVSPSSSVLVVSGADGSTELQLWSHPQSSHAMRFCGSLIGLEREEKVLRIAVTASVALLGSRTVAAVTSFGAMLVWVLNEMVDLRVEASRTLLPKDINYSSPFTSLSSSALRPWNLVAVTTAGYFRQYTMKNPAQGLVERGEAHLPTSQTLMCQAFDGVDQVACVMRAADSDLELAIFDLSHRPFSSGLIYRTSLTEKPPLELRWDSGIDSDDPRRSIYVVYPDRVQQYRLVGPGWSRGHSVGISSSCPITSATTFGEHHFLANSAAWLLLSPGKVSELRTPAPGSKKPVSFDLPWHCNPLVLQTVILLGQHRMLHQLLDDLAATISGDVVSPRQHLPFVPFDDMHAKSEQRLSEETASTILEACEQKVRPDLDEVLKGQLRSLAVITRLVSQYGHVVDGNGLRHLALSESTINNLVEHPDMKSPVTHRPTLLAFYSSNQEILIREAEESSPNARLTWDVARRNGVFLWLHSADELARVMEVVARAEYNANPDERDPVACSLFYMALRKKKLMHGLWKTAYGHSDRNNMLKFLLNDFDEPRWKTASQKNAFALISRQRFLFAASFFLLADRLQDTVNLCVRQLNDFHLAIAIARVYEGDSGPILKRLLEETVLPIAFESGDRWLASWAFSMLDRKALACRCLVDPMESLSREVSSVGTNYATADVPDIGLIILFIQLRKEIPDLGFSTGFDHRLALYGAKALLASGCTDLAAGLLATWPFPRPIRTSRPRRAATSNQVNDKKLKEEELEAVPLPPPKKKLVVVEAVPEFSMDSFGF